MLSTGLRRVNPRIPNVPTNENFEICAYLPNIELPKGGHFALSAATGAIAGMFGVGGWCGDTRGVGQAGMLMGRPLSLSLSVLSENAWTQ